MSPRITQFAVIAFTLCLSPSVSLSQCTFTGDPCVIYDEGGFRRIHPRRCEWPVLFTNFSRFQGQNNDQADDRVMEACRTYANYITNCISSNQGKILNFTVGSVSSSNRVEVEAINDATWETYYADNEFANTLQIKQYDPTAAEWCIGFSIWVREQALDISVLPPFPPFPEVSWWWWSFAKIPTSTMSDEEDIVHFASIITHEVGHGFGLGHTFNNNPFPCCDTKQEVPTMIKNPSYDPLFNTCFNGGIFEANYLLDSLSPSERDALNEKYGNSSWDWKNSPAGEVKDPSCGNTPVALESMQARWEDLAAHVTWYASNQGATAGFYVYRESSGFPTKQRISSLLFGHSGSYEYVDELAPKCGASYWIEEVLRVGGSKVYGPVVLGPRLTEGRLVLHNPYPNPSDNAVSLKFEIEEPTAIELKVYDVVGRVVDVIYEGTLGRGEHEVQWGGKDSLKREVPAGIYIYELIGGGLVLRSRGVYVHR